MVWVLILASTLMGDNIPCTISQLPIPSDILLVHALRALTELRVTVSSAGPLSSARIDSGGWTGWIRL